MYIKLDVFKSVKHEECIKGLSETTPTLPCGNKKNYSRLERVSMVSVSNKKDVCQKKEKKLVNYGPLTLTQGL